MSSQPFDSFLPFAQLIGLSALVSGSVSALINYWINIHDFRKKAKIESLKEKIALYSYLIFQIDKMRFLAEAIKKTPGHTQNGKTDYAHPDRDAKKRETFDNITKTIEGKYYLLKQETFGLWMEANTLFFLPAGIESISKLRELLIEEYNNKITTDYKKLTGIELEKKN